MNVCFSKTVCVSDHRDPIVQPDGVPVEGFHAQSVATPIEPLHDDGVATAANTATACYDNETHSNTGDITTTSQNNSHDA